MGEVFVATDTRLNRKVAIKVLPTEFTSDQARLRRFEQEAKSLATLNHPNVLSIFEVGVNDGAPYLVSELLEGQTLRELLKTGALSQRKAVEYALQVAQGLGAAHTKGIVHRDLKPENIFITKDGRVKILDFGLAKLRQSSKSPVLRSPDPIGTEGGQIDENASAFAEATADMPTLVHATEPGVVLGTLGYMSPEQVCGEEADHRSDIFAFGVVLYEMLSGRPAFKRDSRMATVSAILKEEPRELTVQDLSMAVERVVRRCLEKSPERRFHSAHDLAFALETLSGSSVSSRALTHLQNSRRPALKLIAPWILAVLFGLIAAISLWRKTAPVTVATTGPLAPMRFTIAPPDQGRFRSLALSPDGRWLVFTAMDSTGRPQLYVHAFESAATRPLPGTEDASQPFWSPDSRAVGFFAQDKLKRIDIPGGSPLTLCDAPFPGGGAWSSTGVILFAPEFEDSLFRIPASGGQPIAVTDVKTDPRPACSHRRPTFLPDGRRFLFISSVSTGYRDNAVYLGSLDSKEVRRVLTANSSVAYVGGFLLYCRGNILEAQPFDESTGTCHGDSVPLAQGVDFDVPVNLAGFTVSTNGLLAYLTLSQLKTQLTWFDRTGKPLGTVGEPGHYLGMIALHPDETRAAVMRNNPENLSSDTWVFDLARGTSQRVQSGLNAAVSIFNVWSPDGTRLLQALNPSGPEDLYVTSSGGAGQTELLFASPRFHKHPLDWSRDGRYVLFNSADWNLWILDLEKRQAERFFDSAVLEFWAQFSPDGKWVAYNADETGRSEIWVRRFPSASDKTQISTEGASEPRWRADGKELFYMGLDLKLRAVTFEDKDGRLNVGEAVTLFQTREGKQNWGTQIGGSDNYFAVSKDGQRFLINSVTEEYQPPAITVVQNWTAELHAGSTSASR